MNNYKENQAKIAEARKNRDAIEEQLYKKVNRLRNAELRLEYLKRNAEEEKAAIVEEEILQLKNQISQNHREFLLNKGIAAKTLDTLFELALPQKLVEELDDNLPFLLLPVRIETRFMTVEGKKELWVRIFPDDIAIYTHEKTLTDDEVTAGKAYWTEMWQAEGDSEKKKGAWRALADGYGSQRAAWIAQEMKPLNWPEDESKLPNIEKLEFPVKGDTKQESWSRAPRTTIMPDRFVVMTFSKGKTGYTKVHEVMGNSIPDPLILGPDPMQLDGKFEQKDGELQVDPDMEWMLDFHKAVEIGMGVRIPLQAPYSTQGFDRLLVLGLRLSTDEVQNQELLENVIDNHHYSENGFDLVPQGTPTNNTEGSGSGYSSLDPGEETSFLVETDKPLFTEETDYFQKSDGQRLAEALGIHYETLHYIQHSNFFDVKEAMAMNKALWPATLGYFIEEMMRPVFSWNTIQETRDFFTKYVTGRGPIPAIRVGTQPYGILLTSVFSKWKLSRAHEGRDVIFLGKLYDILKKMENQWDKLVPKVAHVGASGDPHKNLLTMLGLHASSVEYYQRFANGSEYIYNYLMFNSQSGMAQIWWDALEDAGKLLPKELGYYFNDIPRIFYFSFFLNHTLLDGPLIDKAKLSETNSIKPYNTKDNYIDWLINSSVDNIKKEDFGSKITPPKALLYLMLRQAILQEYWSAAMQIYINRNIVGSEARREFELLNMKEEPDLTKWDYLEADVKAVVPDLIDQSMSMADFLQTGVSLQLGEAARLWDIRSALSILAKLPTARLERLFAEHLDLCSYRLDAWQIGMFYHRLLTQRYLHPGTGDDSTRKKGIYLGAFGWLEDLHPAPEPEVVPFSEVPEQLSDHEKGPIIEASDNGGYIHGLSLNHAVTAAVLRNAYITHADSKKAKTMSVNLSSERVRNALSFLEGVRNGQGLSALLGYQFERGLHDRYPDLELDEYIFLIRNKYSLVANKITKSTDNAPIETLEARNVVDGLDLLEAAKLKKGESKSKYPYGVTGLPSANTKEAKAIQKEVDRMVDSMDAIGDLALAESVFQVAQGNYDRAGAMLKAFTEGNNPPDPEIIKTPRSGNVLTNRVTLHFEADLNINDLANNPWNVPFTPRALAEPGLNKWLGAILGDPGNIRCQVHFIGPKTNKPQKSTVISLKDLKIQPIDFIYIIGDELADETTELENRIGYFYRQTENLADTINISIQFIERLKSWSQEVKTFFEILPLARSLRELVTGCRHLTANDFLLPSEENSAEASNSNPNGYDSTELKKRVDAAHTTLDKAYKLLGNKKALIVASYTETKINDLRKALADVVNFGIPEAFPSSTMGTSDEIRDLLVQQAETVLTLLKKRLTEAGKLKDFEAALSSEEKKKVTEEDRVNKYIEAAKAIFGKAFNVLPLFDLKNESEINTAAKNSSHLLRNSTPLVVEEWVQGLSKVRSKMDTLEEILTLNDTFNENELTLTAIQLPFKKDDHWVAVEYPKDVRVAGDILSIVMQTQSNFDPSKPQAGLLVDDWVEVIPNKQETTGIAVHYNQPNLEPPQTLLLAVTPEITGKWKWDDLVDTLHETLERAKRRAVEPDQLDCTAYAQLIPAIMTAVSSFLLATIATDFGANKGL